MKFVLGINPACTGNKGGFALVTLDLQPTIVEYEEIVMGPGLASATFALMGLLAHYKPIVCVAIEDQYLAFNVKSTIVLARGAGRWEEAAEAHDLPVEFVAPRTWQSKELPRSARKRDGIKKASCQRAKMLYNIETNHFAADAIMIARYKSIELALEEFAKKEDAK